MLFNSVAFLVFLAVVYALYRALPFRPQNIMLLVASYVFYGWWDWRFLFLIIFTTTIDFWSGLVLDRGRLRFREIVVPGAFLISAAVFCVALDLSEVMRRITGLGGEASLTTEFLPYILGGIPAFLALAAATYQFLLTMPDGRRRKICVTLSIIVQLTVLGIFKYFNFFVESLVTSLNTAGIYLEPAHFNIVLPVGISFYTFQSLSYTIDIYRRQIRPTDRYFDFALYVAFFPQLVAGPIERAVHLIPQISRPRVLTFEATTRGLFLIMFGLFKKVAIADGLARTVDQIFNGSGAVTWADVVLGTTFFLFQIYCDFSGYSDIARGTAKLFGIDLIVNFNQPLFAKSPGDYWRRWHISLAKWLGNYLYIPLGGNRGSLAFTCRNLMLTMLLGGLWHGAAWNFVIWGFYNGVLLCIERILRRGRRPDEIYDSKPVLFLKIAGNAILTLYGRMLFRATSFDQIVLFTVVAFTGAGGLQFGATLPSASALIGILVLMLWETAQYLHHGDARFYQKYPPALVGLFVATMIFLTFMGMSNEPAQFIYFQF